MPMMKSSIATTSAVALSTTPAPSATLPLVMRTRAMVAPSSETTEAIERPLVAVTGANETPMRLPVTSKASTLVVLGRSTSVKTTPKPFVVAFVVVPLTKKSTSVISLPIGAEDLVAGEGLEARQVRRVEGAEAQRQAHAGVGGADLEARAGRAEDDAVAGQEAIGRHDVGRGLGIVDAVPARCS